jgi:hypothetical protein
MADFEGYARKEIERAFRRNGGKSGMKGAVTGAAGVKKALNKKRDEEEIAKIKDPLIRRSAEDQYRKAQTGSVSSVKKTSNTATAAARRQTLDDKQISGIQDSYGKTQAGKLSQDYRRGQAKVAARNATREDRQRPSDSKPTSATGRKTISSQKTAPSRNTISSRKTTGTISSSAKNSGTISDNQSKMTKEAEENKRKAIADAMKNVRRGP